jgi:SAM-dependent methyltransferase
MLTNTAFDSMAADYDRSFTHSTLGQLMRAAVWRRLNANFAPGQHLLELNCGTGEDALYLARKGVQVVATDVSSAMCALAQQKIAAAHLTHLVNVQPLAIEKIKEIRGWRLEIDASQSPISNLHSLFDGLLSNFGGLNCVSNLRTTAQDLARLLRPGARAVLCIMGPVVPWEWLWYLGKGQPRKAFRRLGRDGVLWRNMRIRYPSVRAVRQHFAPGFRFLRASAVGALLPPSYAEAWANQHPRAINTLNTFERRFETHPVLTNLADHYVIEFERERT